MKCSFPLGYPPLSVIAALAGALMAAQAAAQSASPAAPGDLTRPQFDTETPQFDVTGQMAKAPKTVVAEVDGRPITLGDVGDTIRGLPPAIGQRPFETLFLQARQELIQRQALVILAHQSGVDEDPAILRRLKAASDRVLSDAYLLDAVNAQITEEKLLAAYKDIVAGKPGPEEVRFRLILLGTLKEATDAIADIKGGADFAAVARRISKDPTAAIGGDVAFSTLESLVPEIGAVVFSMTPGQMAPYPLRAVGAWYVLKTEERRRAETPPYAVVRDVLLRALRREGVTAAVKEALTKVTVHEFSITGKSPEGDKP